VRREATPPLAALLDDGPLAGIEGRALGGGDGEVLHLLEEAGMAPEEVLVLGVDLQDDGLA